MTPMLKLVMSKDGTVDKLIGDAVMAFWNAPVDVPRHKELAIECAVEMFVKLDELNKQLALEKLPQLSIGVGVNSGSVVVGNMGSENRFDYTCLGDAVNLSSRLEGQSKPYHVGVVIGEQTVKGIENSFNFLELDNIAVKGKKEGVKIYTVIPKDEKANKIVSHHKKMMDFYYAMNWDEAMIYLIRLKAENSKMIEYYEMLESRISELKTANLPKDWDGVYHATSK
jgi:adenylate cyclase